MLFRNFSKDYYPDRRDLVRYLQAFVDHYQLALRGNTDIIRIDKKDGRFVLEDRTGQTFSCNRLIIATGIAEPWIPEIPGIEFADDYSEMPLDPEDYNGQRVLILGKGNSAFETANHLLGTTSLIYLASPETINLAWKSHFVGHLRAVNNEFLDTYLLKSQNVMIDGKVIGITRSGNEYVVRVHYTHADDEIEELRFDRVITCTGFRFDRSIFGPGCRPDTMINDRFPAMTEEWESTNVEHLYFTGALSQSRDYKKKQSAFIHGFRYNVEFLHRLLDNKYHNKPLDPVVLKPDPQELTQHILQRANSSSALWQQTGYFCDAIMLEGEDIRYFENITLDWARDHLGQGRHHLLLTLEFGQEIIDAAPDPLAVDRIHKDDAARAHLSTGIHPILYRYDGDKLLETHHVIEDIASVWAEEVHSRPLAVWLKGVLSGQDKITVPADQRLSDVEPPA